MEIQGLSFGVNPVNKKENIFGDNIGFVEHYDFSQANMSEKHRIHAISAVASICYQNPKAIGSESLYNRLLAESKGLPSSSFEFVPVLLTEEELEDIGGNTPSCYLLEMSVFKYSEQLVLGDQTYLLTNYRALVYDVEKGYLSKEWLTRFNTEEECKIIKEHFKVFNYKVDLPTRSQMVRHRVSWQELSRRYVSGSRVPFEFYVSDKMKDLYIWNNERHFSIDDFIETSLCLYRTAIDKGIKPQEARRIIPQCAYTQIWGAFMPKQLDNYFKLRLDKHAQWEIQQTAIAMQELIQGDK